jgi:hypothetical protein
VDDLISEKPEVCGLPRTTDAEHDAIVDLLVAFAGQHHSWELSLGYELAAKAGAGNQVAAQLFEKLSPLFDWAAVRQVGDEPVWPPTPLGDLPAGPPRLFAYRTEVAIVQPHEPDELDPRLATLPGLKGLGGARELLDQRQRRREPPRAVWNPGRSVQPPMPELPGITRRPPHQDGPIVTDFALELEPPAEPRAPPAVPLPGPGPGMPSITVVKPQIRAAMVIQRSADRDKPK